MLYSALPQIVTLFADPDPVPSDNDVKAGWLAFWIFIALIVAVVLLGFSLVKQLRKADAAQEAGVYGDRAEPREARGTDDTEKPQAGNGDDRP